MTPDERKILEEAEQQAFDTAQAFYDVPTSGIRPPPSIDETESVLEPELFGYEFGGQPATQSEPGTSSIPPPTPTGACCIGSDCTIQTQTDCENAGGTYQGDDTTCDPNPCAGCVCTKTVDMTVSVTVTDTETGGCDFHATKTETLVSGEVTDLCSKNWGPFEFHYPEYDNGQIFINSIGFGVVGSQICVNTDGVCSAFFLSPCGSGYICFSIGDSYYTGDNPCFNICTPPPTITLSWLLDDGLGFSILTIVTITIS